MSAELSRRDLLKGSIAVMLGAAFGLGPSDAEALSENIVEEAPGVPTFVVRGTCQRPRISLLGELESMAVSVDTPTVDYTSRHGDPIRRMVVEPPTITITHQGQFAIRMEYDEEAE